MVFWIGCKKNKRKKELIHHPYAIIVLSVVNNNDHIQSLHRSLPMGIRSAWKFGFVLRVPGFWSNFYQVTFNTNYFLGDSIAIVRVSLMPQWIWSGGLYPDRCPKKTLNICIEIKKKKTKHENDGGTCKLICFDSFCFSFLFRILKNIHPIFSRQFFEIPIR